jgi:hypothetical protein
VRVLQPAEGGEVLALRSLSTQGAAVTEGGVSGFPARWDGPQFKQPRGTATIKKEKAAKAETDEEILIKGDVKARDKKCRCPLKHKCRGGMEVIHLRDRSLGGAYTTANLWLGCGWIHRRGPVSIHGKDIEIVPLTDKGMDGGCEWWLLTYPEGGGEPNRKLIAIESAPGVIQK